MRHTTRPQIIVAALIVAVLSLIAATTALGQAADGRLMATGSGNVVVDGRVVVFGTLSGRRAVLRVDDRAGDASVRLGNRALARSKGRRGPVVFRGPGTFVVSGSSVRVTLRGEVPNLQLVGSGGIVLAGRGTFTLNDVFYPTWRGRAMRIEPPATAQRRRVRRAAPAAPPVRVTVAPPAPATVVTAHRPAGDDD
jgi:hypothetical protein